MQNFCFTFKSNIKKTRFGEARVQDVDRNHRKVGTCWALRRHDDGLAPFPGDIYTQLKGPLTPWNQSHMGYISADRCDTSVQRSGDQVT